MHPEGLLYTKEHEWILVNGELGTVGITDHAQSELGDVVFVELPQVGAVFQSNDPFGTVESVKAVSELYSPVAGEVVEINPTLADQPEKVNSDPYGEAWMIKIRLSNRDELKNLLTSADYEAYVKSSQGH